MNINEIKQICADYGLRPSKSKGQNFLIDDNIVEKIIKMANIKKTDNILEIGPGLGVLTEKLIENAKSVTAVELDDNANRYLAKKFKAEKQSGKFKLVEGDILKINLSEAGLTDWSFNIVANLPYSITSKFFRQFLEYGPKPEKIVVMIQHEVAKRMLAKPGEMNLLALSAQFFSEPEILFTVSSTCFWPEPEVESAVIKLVLKKKLPDVDVKEMFRLAKFGFGSKRKQLHNNLAGGLKISSDEVKNVLKEMNLREDIRAQDLGVNDWVNLANKIG